MSVTLMARVWQMELPATDKMVLLALADAANDDGVTWIPVASKQHGKKLDLLRKCSLGERAIQGAIKRLHDSGLIHRNEKPGRGCVYTVLPPQEMRPAGNAPPQQNTHTPAADAGKPSVTTNTEAKASYTAVVDLWNELSKTSGIPTIRILNNSRKQMISARIKEHGLETILEAVRRVHASTFCRGGDGARHKADIMYILQPKTLARVLEGFYGGEPVAKIDPALHAQRKRQLADLYDKMGRSDEAAALRREAAALAPVTRAA